MGGDCVIFQLLAVVLGVVVPELIFAIVLENRGIHPVAGYWTPTSLSTQMIML
jgi:hypothetical protein